MQGKVTVMSDSFDDTPTAGEMDYIGALYSDFPKAVLLALR